MQRAYERETRSHYPVVTTLSTHETEKKARDKEEQLIEATNGDKICLNNV